MSEGLVESLGEVNGERDPQPGMARHIARVAARLFAARGYDATSVREIAEAAGVTKPTLYYHFGSKEGLAQALLTQPLERLCGQLRQFLAEARPGRETVAAMTEAHFEFCREDPDRSRFLYALFFGPLGSGLAAEATRFAMELHHLLAEAVERLAAEGVVAPERTGAFLNALRGVLVIHIMDHLYRGENLGPHLACQLVSDLLSGFEAPDTGRSKS